MVELPNPLCFSGMQGHFPRFHPPLPCLHRDKEIRQDSPAAREFLAPHEVCQGGKGDARGQDSSGRCSRALLLQLGNREPGSTLNSSRNWEHSIPLHCLPAKNDSQTLSKLPMIPLQTPSQNGVYIYDFVVSRCVPSQPHLAASKAGFHPACALDMEFGMWHISPYLPFPHLSLSETAKFAAKISIKTHGNVQLYVLNLSLTQVSFTVQITV